jgi:glycosyltransferase involved in cell wall biosynthesis
MTMRPETIGGMNVLFIRFPLESALHGGAENQTIALMEGLRAKGHEVSFLGSCPALLERAKELRIMNYELRIGDPPVTAWGVVSFFWRRKSMQRRLIEEITKLTANSHKPTAIIMLSLSEKLLLTEWAVTHGIKVLWVEHDRIGRWLTKNPWLSAMRRLSKLVTTVCVSDLSRQKYIALGFDPAKVIAIPNGVALPESFSGSKLEARSSQLRLLCIARLSPEKGIDVLLQAITDLPEVELTLVGTGSEEGYVRKLIFESEAREGVSRIRLLQHVDDLERLYREADALVLPSSDHDPFGLVVAEAMVRGIPTIVTDACGIAGYLKDGTDALIVPAGDDGALQDAIFCFLDPEKRRAIREAGKITATTKFSHEEMVKRYEDVLGKT